MYACMCVRIYVCVCTCMCVYTFVCVFGGCTYMHVCVREVPACMCACASRERERECMRTDNNEDTI